MVKLTSRSLLGTFAISSIAFSTATFAYGENPWDLSYAPRAYATGLLGANDIALGQGDILQPIYQQPDRVLFIYGQGRVSENDTNNDNDNNDGHDYFFNKTPYVLSPGIGYRQLANDSALLGAYVFADYDSTNASNHFWDISPGIEALGKVWDFRANGYFPISSKTWEKEGFANQFGNNNYLIQTNHEEYDQWVKYRVSQEVAPGADAEIGRKLFKLDDVLVKAYIGGYYFNTKNDSDITGGSARLTIEPTSYLTFLADDTYDNHFHNTFMLGARIKLNDLFAKDKSVREDQDLSIRLFDPVQRNLGTMSLANSVPATKNKMTLQGETLERDHIYVFNGSNNQASLSDTPEDGTFEHPFTVYDQSKVDYVHQVSPDYSNLYFNHGNYQNYTPATNGNPIAPITIYNNQTLWGRTANYKAEATGDERPIFTGGFNLQTNSALNSLILHNDYNATHFRTGVTMDGANVAINNTEIGVAPSTPGFDPNSSYIAGIEMTNGSNLTLNGSHVYGNKGTTLAELGARIVAADNSSITANNYSIVHGDGENGFGVLVLPDTNSVDTNINMGAISGDGTSQFIGTAYGDYDSIGAGLYAGSDLFGTPVGNITIGKITNSNFIGTNNNGYGVGLYAGNADHTDPNNNVTINTIAHSSFSGTSTGTDTNQSSGYGLVIDGYHATITDISNSNFTGTSTNGPAIGLTTTNRDLLNQYSLDGYVNIGGITNSSFRGISTESIAAGLVAYGYYDVTIGNISGNDDSNISIFSGTTLSSNYTPIGLFVLSFTGKVTIGDISHYNFSAPDTNGIGIALFGSQILIGPDQHDYAADPTPPTSLLTYLNNNGNTFSAGKYKVCVNGTGSTNCI